MNNAKRNKWAALLALLTAQPLLLVGTVATAHDQTRSPFSNCAIDPLIGQGAADWYGGVTNWSPTYRAAVVCGIGQDQALDTNDDVRVYVMDMNGEPGANFMCMGAYSNASQSTAEFTETVYACSTTGGCTSDPGRFAHSLPYMRIDDLHQGGGYTATVMCAIPQRIGTDLDGLSYIKTLLLDEQ